MATEEKFQAPVAIFYSYSHKDETYREELEKHLTTLRLSGLISDWHDRKILAGDEWDKKISEYLEKSYVIMLLISSDFVASKYCYDIEATRALERYNKGEAILIPIILRPVKWELTPFGKIQALPKNAQPVTQWADRDSAYLNICEGILALLTSVKSEQKDSTTENKNDNQEIKPLFTPVEHITSEKVLDAALPEQITVGKTIALVVMIRGKDSEGLKKILRINTQYGVGEEDVISTGEFPLEFSTDEAGKPMPLELNIKIESPDFEQPAQTKNISILPDGDSEPRIFLLTPKKTGDLIVNLELYKGDDYISGCFLKTTTSQNVPQTISTNLVSVSLNKEFLQGSKKSGIGDYTSRIDKDIYDLVTGRNSVEREGEVQDNYIAAKRVDNRAITGIFRDRESAERAYSSVKSRGYSNDDVNLLMSNESRNRYFGDETVETELGSKAMEDAGSAVGGTLGAIIGGIAASGISVPFLGVGLLITGPLTAALAGAGAGSLTGGLASALVSSGISEDRAFECAEALKKGGVLIIITPRNDEDAEYFENEWRNYRGEHNYR